MSDSPETEGELTGKTLGQYEIRGLIGQGGMAAVYLGYQPAIERTVAIKVMPRYFMHDPNFLQRFQREVKLIARLQHPRIVPVFDYGQVEGQPYIVMAYMPSGTLADRLAQSPLPLDEAVRLVEQIAEGLDHAHHEGVIHRDFKPSNILLDKAGNAHLADFGIAKISESTALTGSGMVGTPSYMAPETASGGPVSPAVDIYALGVTLYEMLAGRPPYQGDTAIRVMMSHMNDPIPDIRAERPDLPLGVVAVIQRAMAKDPAHRYSTATEMARALRAAASGVMETAPRRAASHDRTVVEAPLAGYGTGTGLPGATHTPYPAPAAPRPSGCSRPVMIAGGVFGALVVCTVVAAALGYAGIMTFGPFAKTPTPGSAGRDETPGPTDEPTSTAEPPSGEPWQGFVVSAGCESGSILQDIRALDELTVQFTLCRPDPAFLYKLGIPAMGIHPREWIEQNGGTGPLLEQPVGTGPWVFQSADESSVRFARFDRYWGEPAAAAFFEFRWSADPQADFLGGLGDALDDPYDLTAIQNDPNLALVQRPALNIYYLGLPANVSPFDDVRVRQAVAMGLDRQALAESYYTPGTEVASHFTPCALANGCAGPSWYSYDPETARALLAEAGYPDGFSTAFYLWYEPAAFEQSIQAQLAEIGISVEFQVIDYEDLNRRASDGTLDGIWWNGWVSDYPHITNFLDAHFGRNSRAFGGPFPEIYEPLEQASQLVDPVAAAQYYEQANRALRDLAPVVPLFHRPSAAAFRADVENAHTSPIILEEMARMRPDGRDTFVWLDWTGPASFYCADEIDATSVRVCAQFSESLMGYSASGTQPQPELATSCDADSTGLIWTCHLREGVLFHDGSSLDAGDVVTSFAVAWDASNPYHVGRTGAFAPFEHLWGIVND